MSENKIVRNWGYMGPNTPNRRYDTTVGQLMNGFPLVSCSCGHTCPSSPATSPTLTPMTSP